MQKHISNNPIGNAIKVAREAAGYTQHDLARLTGTTQATISGVERGAKDARLSTLQRIAQVLEASIVFLPRATARNRQTAFADKAHLSLRERFGISDDEADDEASP